MYIEYVNLWFMLLNKLHVKNGTTAWTRTYCEKANKTSSQIFQHLNIGVSFRLKGSFRGTTIWSGELPHVNWRQKFHQIIDIVCGQYICSFSICTFICSFGRLVDLSRRIVKRMVRIRHFPPCTTYQLSWFYSIDMKLVENCDQMSF